MTVSEIIAALPGLRPEELRQVEALAQSLLRAARIGVTTDVTDFVYECFAELLSDRAIRLPPVSVFRSSPESKRIRLDHGAEVFDDFLTLFRPRDQAERRAAAHICLKILEEHLVSNEIPVRLRTMAQLLPDIGTYVERSFPGYRASGLLPLVLKTMREQAKR